MGRWKTIISVLFSGRDPGIEVFSSTRSFHPILNNTISSIQFPYSILIFRKQISKAEQGKLFATIRPTRVALKKNVYVPILMFHIQGDWTGTKQLRRVQPLLMIYLVDWSRGYTMDGELSIWGARQNCKICTFIRSLEVSCMHSWPHTMWCFLELRKKHVFINSKAKTHHDLGHQNSTGVWTSWT